MKIFTKRERELLVGDAYEVVETECKCNICGKDIIREDFISIQRQAITISTGMGWHIDPRSEHTHLDICEKCEKAIILHLRGIVGVVGVVGGPA